MSDCLYNLCDGPIAFQRKSTVTVIPCHSGKMKCLQILTPRTPDFVYGISSQIWGLVKSDAVQFEIKWPDLPADAAVVIVEPSIAALITSIGNLRFDFQVWTPVVLERDAETGEIVTEQFVLISPDSI